MKSLDAEPASEAPPPYVPSGSTDQAKAEADLLSLTE